MTGERDVERIPAILERLTALESEQKHFEVLWKSSVDDIKATIRSEISDLKNEQIKDLRKIIDTDHLRVNDLERRQDRWEGGAGVSGWLIKIMIGLSGALAGYFGSGHVR